MNRTRGLLILAALAAAAAVAVVIAVKLREEEQIALQAVDDIENQIADLDPIARAAVVAKLSSDLVGSVKGEVDAIKAQQA